MYYTPDNYEDMEIGSEVRDIYFGLTWTVVEKKGNGEVVVQNRVPEGAKLYLSKDNSQMIFLLNKADKNKTIRFLREVEI